MQSNLVEQVIFCKEIDYVIVTVVEDAPPIDPVVMLHNVNNRLDPTFLIIYVKDGVGRQIEQAVRIDFIGKQVLMVGVFLFHVFQLLAPLWHFYSIDIK